MSKPDLHRAASLARLRAAQLKASVRRVSRSGRGGGPGSYPEAGEAVPVAPDRPLDLSGGAAAALEFDD